MPAAVLFSCTDVAEIVLLAEFIRDPRSGVVEIAEAADDFRAAACVVGNLSQGVGIHTLGRCALAGAAANDRREAARPSTAGNREWNWHRNLDGRPVSECRRRSVHAERVHEHLALSNELTELA